MANSKPSICFDCQNGYAHRCGWVRAMIPVKGWKSEIREFSSTTGTGFTCSVISCPNFKKETQREKQKIEEQIISLLTTTDLGTRKIADICGVSTGKVYYTLEKCLNNGRNVKNG